MATLLLIAFLIMAIWMAQLWAYAERVGEADIVDAGWSAGIGVVATIYACYSPGDKIRSLVMALLVLAWSMRLTSYILKRVLEPGEDGRYAELRSSWGQKASTNFFIFFQLQGALVVILSLPFIAVITNQRPFGSFLDLVAIILSVISILGETIADKQLAQFRANPENRGKVCEVGLWAYSRHPNYFFEWFHWLSYILLSIGSQLFLFSPISAIIMLVLILRVTGIPPTEARALISRGDAYRDYQRRVSAFVPWFRKAV
jgi:steroid 5-alpha reductase family enzyme